MAHVMADRVWETSATTGTGTYALAGAVTGLVTFSAGVGNGNTTYYCATDGTSWEIGLGTVAAGTLARTTIIRSSNANAAVSWLAGSKDVFCTAPAGRSLILDANSDLTIPNDLYTGAGSASLPSHSFAADPDTGLANLSANKLSFVTNGAERVSIDSGGVMRATNSLLWEVGGSRNIGFVPVTSHQAGNVGDTIFGVNDGGGFSGMVVTNSHNGSLSSQTVDIRTAQGGISSATTRCRFTVDGLTQFGQTSTSTPGYGGNTTTGLGIWNTNGRTFQSQDAFSNWNMNSDGNLITFCRSGNAVGSIGVSTTSTAFNTSSDYRLKTDIEPLTGALDRLDLLQPKRFRFIVEPAMDKVDGFLAHEAQAAVPEAVNGAYNATDFGGNPEYQTIDQSKLVPLLVAALQELRAEFNAYVATHP